MGHHLAIRGLVLVLVALNLVGCSATTPAVTTPNAAGTTPGATTPAAGASSAVGASATTASSGTASAAPEPSGPVFVPTGRTEPARVVRVVDGDTIIVRLRGRDRRLRYIGMDSPETKKPDTPVEWMGREAAAANEALVAGRVVVLEKDVSETDRFGRLLRHVWLHQGSRWTLVGLELVARGFAQAATFPPDVKYVDRLLAAQRAARAAGLGLWGPRPSGVP